MVCSIDVEQFKGPRFRFLISENGEQVCTCDFKELSPECCRLTFARGTLSTEINAALTRHAYEMGYLRMVFYAPPEQKVTQLAKLYRKAARSWSYMIPLEELYG